MRIRSVRTSVVGVLGCALLASGCSLAVGVARERSKRRARDSAAARERLANVKSITVALAGGQGTYCPGGEPAALKVTAVLDDGKQVDLPGNGISARMIRGEASVGHFDNGLRFVGPTAPLSALEEDAKLVVTLDAADRGKASAELALTPTYDCEQVARFAGEAGQPGDGGASGQGGNSGSKGSPGGNGASGGDAGNGGPGGDAAPVEVAIAPVRSAKHGALVLARVRRAGEDEPAYFLLAPDGPGLRVDARGGQGGAGGSGGQGGSGGFGHSENTVGECCNTNGGNGGQGGDGGVGGNGGRGAAVTVRFDKRHPELKALVKVDNGGGAAGEAGGPGGAGHPGSGGSGSQGQRAQDGQFGVQGAGGRPGRAGIAGPAPKVVGEPAAKLFKDEVADGLKLER